MNDDAFDFEKLVVYQKALKYVAYVYSITKVYPKEEQYSLVDQFRRAATSICLNTAEGSGGTKLEFKQFLKIARRSIRECVAITDISFQQGYIDVVIRKQVRASCLELSRMISGLLHSL
jgi:four helix bundle protein